MVQWVMLLLLKKSRVQFISPKRNYSQLSVTPNQGNHRPLLVSTSTAALHPHKRDIHKIK